MCFGTVLTLALAFHLGRGENWSYRGKFVDVSLRVKKGWQTKSVICEMWKTKKQNELPPSPLITTGSSTNYSHIHRCYSIHMYWMYVVQKKIFWRGGNMLRNIIIAIYLGLWISISQELLLPLLLYILLGRNTGATKCLFPFLHTYDNSLSCCLECIGLWHVDISFGVLTGTRARKALQVWMSLQFPGGSGCWLTPCKASSPRNDQRGIWKRERIRQEPC